MSRISLISSDKIASAVCRLYSEINVFLREDVEAAIRSAAEREESELARDILHQLLENAQVSRREGLPLCQDTGLAVAFVEMGNAVLVEHGTVADAINEGVL